jgi:hypothetical protein
LIFRMRKKNTRERRERLSLIFKYSGGSNNVHGNASPLQSRAQEKPAGQNACSAPTRSRGLVATNALPLASVIDAIVRTSGQGARGVMSF